MKATIDIKTLSGKSLEGFPDTFNVFNEPMTAYITLIAASKGCNDRVVLHKGDTITIRIEE